MEAFIEILGRDHVLTGERLAGRNPGYCAESLDAGLVLRPASVDELSAVCRAASANSVALIPHGGLTGLVEGTASRPGQAIVSFERMNRILEIDPEQAVAVVEPGLTLESLQAALAPHGLIFGVDIPSRGSCTIGGMIATNAGGARVLRYGMTRQNVVGLEAVLADGRVLDVTSPLIKNNAGYDLKQMFIGSEGTLGLVSKAVLRLWPAPRGTCCALLACEGASRLCELFAGARAGFGADLLSFEAMWPDYYRMTTAQPGFGAPPLGRDHGVYAVIEIEGRSDVEAQEALLAFLGPDIERGRIVDAVIAQSGAERARIWRTREDSDAIERLYEDYLSYDVGVRLADLGPFVDRLAGRFRSRYPDLTLYVFGHVGDGNLHVMFGFAAAERARRDVYDGLLYDTVAEFGGTISAEHGVGLEKRAYLDRSVTPAALAAMKRLKAAFDPAGILNPGKIFTL